MDETRGRRRPTVVVKDEPKYRASCDPSLRNHPRATCHTGPMRRRLSVITEAMVLATLEVFEGAFDGNANQFWIVTKRRMPTTRNRCWVFGQGVGVLNFSPGQKCGAEQYRRMAWAVWTTWIDSIRGKFLRLPSARPLWLCAARAVFNGKLFDEVIHCYRNMVQSNVRVTLFVLSSKASFCRRASAHWP